MVTQTCGWARAGPATRVASVMGIAKRVMGQLGGVCRATISWSAAEWRRLFRLRYASGASHVHGFVLTLTIRRTAASTSGFADGARALAPACRPHRSCHRRDRAYGRVAGARDRADAIRGGGDALP